MIKFNTLYKRSYGGKVLVWFMEIDGDRYRTTSGQLEGKKVTSEWTVAKPKNVGKENETTAAEQAQREVEAEYKKKLEKDYRPTLDNVDELLRFKPMLATKWTDRQNKIDQTNIMMQPKLDGVRCIATKTGLWTREGKRIYGAPHIFAALEKYFQADGDLILDGELYNHSLKDNFNKIVSAVKKQKPTEKDLEVSKELIQYWVYDIPSVKKSFSDRSKHLMKILNNAPKCIIVVDTISCSVDNVDKVASDMIEEGFEGAMIRLDSKYENKRSNNLIKYKEFQDEEFKIIDIQEGDGNRAGMAARVLLDNGSGIQFGAGLIGDVEYCRAFLINKDKYIGKMGTVVFQNLTPDGVPRFPKFKGVRFDV
jgi:DNA ligase-1